ncbi:MAG: hypothetical protein EOP84_07610 [Verrucomicrobiaceae bacterium]|nr:MAG: hypothetical protein EOP84_07610 [Verrucomicrobiaceae bacterium]
MPKSVVECADTLKALHRHRWVQDQLAAFLIFGTSVVVGAWLEKPGVGVLGILTVGGLIIVPRLLRFNRAVQAMHCPSCGKPAGSFVSHGGIIHLRCKSCGKETETDCLIPYAGGPPTKNQPAARPQRSE